MTGAMAGSRMHDAGRDDGSLGTQGSAMGHSRADSKAARRGAAAEHRQGDGAQQGSATGRSSRQKGSATGRSSRAQARAAAAAGHGEVEAAAGHAQRSAGRYAGLGRGGWTAIRRAIRRAIRLDAAVGRGNKAWTRRLGRDNSSRARAALRRAIHQDDGADKATARRLIGGWQVSRHDGCQDATVKAQSTRRPQGWRSR